MIREPIDYCPAHRRRQTSKEWTHGSQSKLQDMEFPSGATLGTVTTASYDNTFPIMSHRLYPGDSFWLTVSGWRFLLLYIYEWLILNDDGDNDDDGRKPGNSMLNE